MYPSDVEDAACEKPPSLPSRLLELWPDMDVRVLVLAVSIPKYRSPCSRNSSTVEVVQTEDDWRETMEAASMSLAHKVQMSSHAASTDSRTPRTSTFIRKER